MSTAADTTGRYSTAKLLSLDYKAIQGAAKDRGVHCTEAFSALRLMMEELPETFHKYLCRIREPQPYNTSAHPAG